MTDYQTIRALLPRAEILAQLAEQGVLVDMRYWYAMNAEKM